MELKKKKKRQQTTIYTVLVAGTLCAEHIPTLFRYIFIFPLEKNLYI